MKRHPFAWTFGLSLVPAAWASEPVELESTTISASALAKKPHEMTTPAEVLEGDELILRRGATLGETLEGLPGVRSASFGAGVGRPIVRGQQGARVKMLSDGLDTLDASSVSPDHAVTSEPLLAERIEVLKGPATLLYGGGAIGGVVNTLDKRVPTYVPERGYEGELELRANSVANEGSGVFGITAGRGPFAVRVEGVKRQADDYAIHGSPGKQEGSYNDTDSFALGASFVGARGYLGAAYSEQDNRYGLVGHQHAGCHLDGALWQCGDEHEDESGSEEGDEHAEEGVPYVDLRQRRWDLRGELADPLPGFERARLRVAHSDYRHREIEGGLVSTRFDNDASDARLELTHQPLSGWHGVLGGQSLRRDFAASGEEAYVPPTLTRNHALFLLEEYTAGAWRYELGLRHEWQDIEAEDRPDTDHRGTSFSAGAVWTFARDYSLGFSLSRSQRLPSAEELYADGPHAATRTVERGDPGLDEETSRNFELTLRKFAGRTTFSLTLYRNRVDDYIYAADTGRDIGSGYREIEYRQADALFTGAEGELRFQAGDATAVTLFGDRVRGKLLDGGGDLPRIPADRLGVRLEHAFASGLDGQLEFYQVNHQHRLADFETQTSGYGMLGARLARHGALGRADYLVYLKGDNLLDRKIREHSSFVKDDVVQPGRNLTLGVRMTF